MGTNDDKILEAFRKRFQADHGQERLKSVEDYQRVFRGFEDLIAREFALLAAEHQGGPATHRPTASASSSAMLDLLDSAAPAQLVAPAPRVVGHFRLLRELGRGAQGSVHLADDTRLHRHVALKLLDAPRDGPGPALERFRRAVEITSGLHHEGICALLEAGEDDGHPWIAMRYVEGRTLADRIEESRASLGVADGEQPSRGVVQLPAEGKRAVTSPSAAADAGVLRVCRFFENAARASHAAHEQGLVHRDIRPGNLIVTGDGDPVVLDFGLAPVFATDDSAGSGGTPGARAYQSPEQLLDPHAPLDARCDIWSLGVSLFECLTLRRPFDAPTREALEHQIRTAPPRDARRLNPAIPADLAVVLQTALRKHPDRRYRTALALADDLRRVQEGLPVAARPVPHLARLLSSARSSPGLSVTVCGLIIVLAAAVAVTSARLGDAQARLRRVQQSGLVAASQAAEDAHPMRSLLLARTAVRLGPGSAALARLRAALTVNSGSGTAIPAGAGRDELLALADERVTREFDDLERSLYADLLDIETPPSE